MTKHDKTKPKRDTTWQYTGDISPEDYGGKWFRRTHVRQFQFIELTNMDDACGRDNEGHATYVVELSLVDLDMIDESAQKSALRSCGSDLDGTSGADLDDAQRAVACYEYGANAPLESWTGNAWSRMLREARSTAHVLKHDAREMALRMQRPVNALGSTASEYMRGDIMSAIGTWRRPAPRGLAREARGDRRADALAIDTAGDARPADWMPYMLGYQDGIRALHSDERGLAPEYERGYKRGVLVASGAAVAPGWIKVAR